MPISAVIENKVVFSTDYSDEEWDRLRSLSREQIQLRCCGTDAVLKRSKRGLNYFAHKPHHRISCPWKSKNNFHDELINSCLDLLHNKGFDCELEQLVNEKVCLDFLLTKKDGDKKIGVMLETAPISQRTLETINSDNLSLKKLGFDDLVWLVPSSWEKHISDLNALYYRGKEKLDTVTAGVRELSCYINSRHMPKESRPSAGGFPVKRAVSERKERETQRSTIEELKSTVEEMKRSSVGGPNERVSKLKTIANSYLGKDADKWLGSKIGAPHDDSPLELAKLSASYFVISLSCLIEKLDKCDCIDNKPTR